MGTGRSTLSSRTLSKLENVTLFTPDEILSWHKGFCKQCPNGEMTLPQFLSLFNDIFLKNQQNLIVDGQELEKYGAEVFRVIDKDSSGTIDFKEFIIHASVETKGSVEQKLQNVFQLYDMNENGFITMDEMIELFKIINKAVDFGDENVDGPKVTPEKIAVNIFRRLDRNKDGRLTVFEFISGVSTERCLVKYFVGGPDFAAAT